jgi:DNA-binding GntR family transcriptional regulator
LAGKRPPRRPQLPRVAGINKGATEMKTLLEGRLKKHLKTLIRTDNKKICTCEEFYKNLKASGYITQKIEGSFYSRKQRNLDHVLLKKTIKYRAVNKKDNTLYEIPKLAYDNWDSI